MSQPKRPDIQGRFERRMDFIFSECIYDDLMLAIKEIRSEQKQMGEASVNSEPVNSECKAFAH